MAVCLPVVGTHLLDMALSWAPGTPVLVPACAAPCAATMNLTVAWVHFFAEGYYTAAVQVPLLMLLGVTPEMVAIILVIDGTWGTFIHCGEGHSGTAALDGWNISL